MTHCNWQTTGSGNYETTNATPVQRELFRAVAGKVPSAALVASINVEVEVTARDETTGDRASYKLWRAFTYDGAGSMDEHGSTVVLASHEDDSSWNATLEASSDGVYLELTGDATNHTIWGWRWKAFITSDF